MDAAGLLERLRARLSEPRRADHPELTARLTDGLRALRERWPHAPAPDDDFAAYLAARLEAQPDLTTALPRLRVDDLFLAWWAGGGDARAIAAFEAAHEPGISALVRRFHRLPEDELRQRLRVKLFVGANTSPRIRDYSGFGFLENWVRVTAARAFVDAARADDRRRVERDLDEDLLLGTPDPGDPRGDHVRRELGAVVKQAFAAAVAALSPRARTFLRHAHVDHLTLDQIAATYRVHRATVARTLGAARAELLDGTRARVANMFAVGDDDLASVVRMLDSRIDLSLSRVLRADGPLAADSTHEARDGAHDAPGGGGGA